MMNRKLLKSAATALVLGAGLATFAREGDTPNQGGTSLCHLQGRHGDFLTPHIGYDWQNWSMINSLFSRFQADYKFGTTEIVQIARR